MTPFDIWFLLAVFLGACTLAALYEWAALKLHLFPSITQEVRQGARTYPLLYAPVLFFLGALFGHLFWQ
jgi:hypothetical protein